MAVSTPGISTYDHSEWASAVAVTVGFRPYKLDTLLGRGRIASMTDDNPLGAAISDDGACEDVEAEEETPPLALVSSSFAVLTTDSVRCARDKADEKKELTVASSPWPLHGPCEENRG
jgi:hypothetical protein